MATVERLPDYPAFYGKVKRGRVTFCDGMAEVWPIYSDVLVVSTDEGKIIGAATLVVRLARGRR